MKVTKEIKFILQGIAFLFIIFLLVELIIYLDPNKEFDKETHFAASIIDKQGAIEKLPSPKLVLVGGSSVAYGIDSQLLQDSLKIPVMNMSFQYFLGTDFLLKQVKEHLKTGDVLVISFEHIAEAKGTTKEKLIVQSFYPKAKEWIVYDGVQDYLQGNLLLKTDKIKSIFYRSLLPVKIEPTIEDTINIFFRKGLNKQGDLVGHLNNPSMKKIPNSVLNYTLDFKNTIDNVNYHVEEIEKNGVKVYFSFCPYNKSAFDANKDAIERMKKITYKEANYTFLDTPEDNVFNDSLFQDMSYHLNKNGRRIRTLQLLKKLKEKR